MLNDSVRAPFSRPFAKLLKRRKVFAFCFAPSGVYFRVQAGKLCEDGEKLSPVPCTTKDHLTAMALPAVRLRALISPTMQVPFCIPD